MHILSLWNGPNLKYSIEESNIFPPVQIMITFNEYRTMQGVQNDFTELYEKSTTNFEGSVYQFCKEKSGEDAEKSILNGNVDTNHTI